MSVAELFNNGDPHPWANLRVNTITTDGGSTSNGKLTIANTSASGTGNIIINQVTPSTANDIQFQSNGTQSMFVGYNSLNSIGYIQSVGDLQLYTGGVNRLQITSGGIPINNAVTSILGMNGPLLSIKNDFPVVTFGSLLISFSGAINPQPFGVFYYKIGRIVTVTFDNIQSGAVGGINNSPISSAAGSIPANILPEFLTSITLFYPIRIINGALSVNPGALFINNDGSITLNATLAGGLFNNIGTRGSYSTTITYRSLI